MQYSLLDTIIGITGQANIKSASKYFCVSILFGVSIIFSSKVFLLSANNFAVIPEKIWIELNSTVHYPYHHTI